MCLAITDKLFKSKMFAMSCVLFDEYQTKMYFHNYQFLSHLKAMLKILCGNCRCELGTAVADNQYQCWVQTKFLLDSE